MSEASREEDRQREIDNEREFYEGIAVWEHGQGIFVDPTNLTDKDMPF